MRIELDIPEDKLEEVLEVLQKLPYVKYSLGTSQVSEQAVAYQTEIPQWQQDIVLERLRNLDRSQCKSWEEVKKEFDAKYGR